MPGDNKPNADIEKRAEEEEEVVVVVGVVVGCQKHCNIFFPFRHASVSVFIVYMFPAVIDQQVRIRAP